MLASARGASSTKSKCDQYDHSWPVGLNEEQSHILESVLSLGWALEHTSVSPHKGSKFDRVELA